MTATNIHGETTRPGLWVAYEVEMAANSGEPTAPVAVKKMKIAAQVIEVHGENVLAVPMLADDRPVWLRADQWRPILDGAK